MSQHQSELKSRKLLAAAERPLFVLGLGRPELHDGFPHLWEERGVQELRLEPLSKAASQRLVREALGPGLSDELLGEVIARAGGNAFFLEELVRAVSSVTVRFDERLSVLKSAV